MPIEKSSNNQPPIDDGGECSNSTMDFKSLVSVDMKKLSHSELYSLSRSSSDAIDPPENDVTPNVIKSSHRPTCAIFTSTTTPRRISAFSRRRGTSCSDTPVPENKLILNSIQKLIADGDTAETALALPAPPPVDNRSEFPKRKRKRNSENENEFEGLGVINVNGESINLKYLAVSGDRVFESELNKMTEGMVTENEFLGFLEGLEGRWGSNRRRRKFVDARVLVKVLPDKWELQLSLRPRARQPSLYCRQFVSPLGKPFKSCKDVAFYLKSLCLTNNANRPEEGAIVLVEPDDQMDPESVAMVHRSSNPASKTDILGTDNYMGSSTSIVGLESPLQKCNGKNIQKLTFCLFAPPPVDNRSEVPKRKRKRKLENENEFEGLGVINVNGESVDLKYLAVSGDGVFESELNKMTEGMVTENAFLGFLKGLEGSWGSDRRRRKFVDARVLVKLLPDNWQLQLSLRPRACQPSLYCRQFVSPLGKPFKSCKDVAFYLKSLLLTNNANRPEEGAIVLVEPDDQMDPESVARVHRSSNPASKTDILGNDNYMGSSTSIVGLESPLQKCNGKNIQRLDIDTLNRKCSEPRGSLIIREPGYQPPNSVKQKTVVENKDTGTKCTELKYIPMNGEGSSSSGPKNNSEMNGNLKIRCMLCHVELVCNPVDAGMLPASWGFICPKCKDVSLTRLTQRADN